jgi:hypothetical protein
VIRIASHPVASGSSSPLRVALARPAWCKIGHLGVAPNDGVALGGDPAQKRQRRAGLGRPVRCIRFGRI